LAASAAVLDGKRRGRRPCLHQLDWNDGRLRWTDRDGMADRSNGIIFRRTGGDGGIPASGGRLVLVAQILREAGLTADGVNAVAPCYFLKVIVFKNVRSAFSSSCPVGNLFACRM